jgi:hypothetical protein
MQFSCSGGGQGWNRTENGKKMQGRNYFWNMFETPLFPLNEAVTK